MPGETRERIRQFSARPVDRLHKDAEEEARSDFADVPVIFSPTGGTRVDFAELRSVATAIRLTASENGYPRTMSTGVRELGRNITGAHTFDVLAAIQLHRRLSIHPHEASKDGVWEFFTCVLLPDVVRWRFPGSGVTSDERFLGGVRNVFARLWWRAYLLFEPSHYDPYRLLKFLNEDEIVQITERPVIGFNQRLTRFTVEAFIETLQIHKRVPRMELMREAQKHLSRSAPLISFDAVDDADLRSWVGSIFSRLALLPQLNRA